jgi:hypothetical protein
MISRELINTDVRELAGTHLLSLSSVSINTFLSFTVSLSIKANIGKLIYNVKQIHLLAILTLYCGGE